MTFESFPEGLSFFLWATFILSIVLGAVVNKTNFCTMGAVSDMVNMSDYSRLRAWFLAIGVAMLGVTIFEYLAMVDATNTFPPYRSSQLILGENIIGGLLFGIGMTLGSGCGNKTLIRIGGGNIKSILVFLIIGLIAYYMLNPFPGSDVTLFSALFYDWVRPLSINLGTPQDLGAIVSTENAGTSRLILGVVVAAGILFFVFKSKDFRSGKDNLLGGMVVGLAVLFAWYLSSNIAINADDSLYSLSDYYEGWDMLAESDEGKPAQGRPLSSQSFTFINPIGQTFGYIKGLFDNSLLSFGIMSVLGIILGSFIWSVVSKSFRIEWFASTGDFITHVVGATLMGFGGTLALGCTVGQGITGVSTLAVGSIVSLMAIIFGAALTMKIQYYKLVYEDEASFSKALITSLVDMKMLPSSMRKLDAV